MHIAAHGVVTTLLEHLDPLGIQIQPDDVRVDLCEPEKENLPVPLESLLRTPPGRACVDHAQVQHRPIPDQIRDYLKAVRNRLSGYPFLHSANLKTGQSLTKYKINLAIPAAPKVGSR